VVAGRRVGGRESRAVMTSAKRRSSAVASNRIDRCVHVARYCMPAWPLGVGHPWREP
jgi:hypothetical protein